MPSRFSLIQHLEGIFCDTLNRHKACLIITDVLDLMYTSVNIPGAGCDMTQFEISPAGCQCSDQCDSDKCSDQCTSDKCSDQCTSDKCPHTNHTMSPDTMIFECNDLCTCDTKCSKRVVQKGPKEGLLVIDTDTMGKGVITEHDIAPGQFVCEYAGEVIGGEVAKARFTNQVIVSIRIRIM